MPLPSRLARLVFALLSALLPAFAAAAASASKSDAEAAQLRIIQSMSEQLRARIADLPVLLPSDHPAGEIAERVVTLNRTPVVVDGQRFDGIVVLAPATKAAFAWAFAAPTNSASWYILRERGEMKGFANFLRRPRAQVPAAATMKPEPVTHLTFQTLPAEAWAPGERYILWFRFNDDAPVELSLRAGFFPRPSLTNNALPALLFPAPTKAK